jgi:hypothetical protein
MRTVVCVIAVAIVSACASAGKIQPTIHIRAVQVPEARTPLANQFSTILELEIMNPSTESLTVDRIQLGSVSLGTFTIDPVVERPQKVIAPGTTELFRVWAQMRVQQETPSDGQDPILIRGAVDFLASTGAFRRTFAKQVNPSTLR